MSLMRPLTILFVLWEGGGNVPPILGLARRMKSRGHRTMVISDPCNESEVSAAGAEFFPYTTAPHRYDKTAASTLLRDYEAANTIQSFKFFLEHIACGPALAYARDVLGVLKNHKVDLVVVNEALFGGCFAAEVMKLPCVMVIPGTSSFPAPGMPPPGMMPKKGLMGKLMDKISSIVFKKLIAYGLPKANEARTALGLSPISNLIDYTFSFPKRVLVMTSPDFEFEAEFPANLRITGPILDDPFVEENKEYWQGADDRKLVLVGFSTTFQNHAGILQKIVDAMHHLPYRALLTLGPAMEENLENVPENVTIRSFIPHSEILPQCAAVITHAGHGTVIRSLAYGVPLVCMPLGRDQTANAARVAYRGVGIKLNKNTSVHNIANAIEKVVEHPDFRNNAKGISIKIREQSNSSRACKELEKAAVS